MRIILFLFLSLTALNIAWADLSPTPQNNTPSVQINIGASPYPSPYLDPYATSQDWFQQQQQQYLIQQKLQQDLSSQQYQMEKMQRMEMMTEQRERAKCIDKIKKKCDTMDLNQADFNQRTQCNTLNNAMNYNTPITDAQLNMIGGRCE